MLALSIPDMSCGHCKAAVEATVKHLDPAAIVTIDLAGKQARIDTGADTADLLAALSAQGYPATVTG